MILKLDTNRKDIWMVGPLPRVKVAKFNDQLVDTAKADIIVNHWLGTQVRSLIDLQYLRGHMSDTGTLEEVRSLLHEIGKIYFHFQTQLKDSHQ